MSQPDFSEYLDKVCSGIQSKSKRQDVYSELLCHLWDNYERNIAVGMTEEEARQDAISKMGDRDTLTYRLGEIHSFSPANSMKSALSVFMLAFCMMSFPFSSTAKMWVYCLGLMPMFSALLRMRKLNKSMNSAFVTFCVSVLSDIVFYGIGIDREVSEWYTGITLLLRFEVRALMWLLMFAGLNRLFSEYDRPDKRVHLIPCGIYVGLMNAVTGIFMLLTRGEEVTIPSIILSGLYIFFFIYSLVQLSRLRSALWDADGEYGILPNDKKHKITITGTLAGCIALVIAFTCISAFSFPDKREFVLHDLESAAQTDTAEKARENMLSLGLPQAILDDLPDSEVVNYADAVYMTEAHHISVKENRGREEVTLYSFFTPDKNSEKWYDTRMLFTVQRVGEYKSEKTKRAGFYITPFADEFLTLNEDKENFGVFASVITEENGKKYSSDVYSTKNLDDGQVLEYVKGFEYLEEPVDQKIYYAQTFGIRVGEYTTPERMAAYNISRTLLTFPNKRISDCVDRYYTKGTFHSYSEDPLFFDVYAHRLDICQDVDYNGLWEELNKAK